VYSLEDLGWCEFFEKQRQQKQNDELMRARVSEENRALYKIISERGERLAELRENCAMRPLRGRCCLQLVIGCLRMKAERERRFILFLSGAANSRAESRDEKLRNKLSRRNVGTVFLVSSLNREFNARRVERYLTLAWESGARPTVVLNKADLCENIAELREEAEHAAMGVRTIVASVLNGEGILELREIVRNGDTTALLGSSGVGKSSLINAILGKEIQITKEIRESDDRGRHATTSRQLIVAPGGGVLLDTPGMRELQLWDAKRRNRARVCGCGGTCEAVQVPGLFA